MHIARMFIAFCLVYSILLPSTGCKKRSGEAGPSVSPAVMADGSPAPVVVDPPKNLPPNSLPLPRPVAKPWSQRSQPEKIMVLDYWLNQHQFGDAAQKSKVVSEIRAAGLSPADLASLEEARKRFGYAPLGL